MHSYLLLLLLLLLLVSSDLYFNLNLCQLETFSGHPMAANAEMIGKSYQFYAIGKKIISSVYFLFIYLFFMKLNKVMSKY